MFTRSPCRTMLTVQEGPSGVGLIGLMGLSGAEDLLPIGDLSLTGDLLGLGDTPSPLAPRTGVGLGRREVERWLSAAADAWPLPLTCLSPPYARVAGLEAGADDFEEAGGFEVGE